MVKHNGQHTTAPNHGKVVPGLPTVRVRIDTLYPDPANVNTHDERNMRAIMGSLRQFGQVEPLVVQKSTRKVIGGNGRLEAMRQLGIVECDIVELDIGNVEATALGIALNRTAQTSKPDDVGLAELLRSLQSEDFPLDGVGFTEQEVNELVAKLGDGLLGGKVVDDPQGEWQGMPECENEDQSAYRTLHVHFASADDLKRFSEIIDQSIPEKAPYIWFPPRRIEHHSERTYVDSQ